MANKATFSGDRLYTADPDMDNDAAQDAQEARAMITGAAPHGGSNGGAFQQLSPGPGSLVPNFHAPTEPQACEAGGVPLNCDVFPRTPATPK